MAMQVLMPSRAPTQLDALSTALQIGSTLYNIKYEGEKLELAKQEAARNAENQNLQKTVLQEQVAEKQSERAAKERLAKGEMTHLEFGKFVKDSGYAISQTPTDVRVKVGGKDIYLTQKPDTKEQLDLVNLQKAKVELANLPDKLKREIQNQEIEKNYKIAKTLEAMNTQNSAEKAAFARLPTENQEMIKDLAKKNVNLISIQNEIKTALQILTDPAVSEDQKIVQGKALLKTLNSTQGADAIGAEESKRLGSFLEFKIANITQPGSFIGRDLNDFIEQTALTADRLDGTINQNAELITQMRSGQSGTQPRVSELKRTQEKLNAGMRGGLIQNAQAAQNKPKKFDPNKKFTSLE